MQGTAAERPPFLFVGTSIAAMVRAGGPPMTWQRLKVVKEVVGGPPARTMTTGVLCLFRLLFPSGAIDQAQRTAHIRLQVEVTW
jgi:hypothetical protein